MKMTSAEIRARFLSFFAERGHEIVPSGSLIPGNDATLLFTNAGMVPFKDVFLGTDKRAYNRAVSSQRCVRAGGKHNDLENVGYTARHHTFFEMLGNFSFGDYFKREAIQFAWQFLTEELQLPEEKLWVTVFEEDDEAYHIWAQEMNVPEARIRRIGAADNFWQMGDTGPCGPCSEIFYDHGEAVFGGPPGSPDEDGDRYIEIWNLVFMQYNRDSDGVLHPLPKPSVDTGMGLERIAAVMQGVHSNYETDTFVALIKKTIEITQTQATDSKSLQVIADHIRSCSFLIADGVLPSNEGRGYVLRRIIRRAVRHGYKLGVEGAFFYKLVPELVRLMGDAFPELAAAQSKIEAALKQEEAQFARTVQRGLSLLDEALDSLKAGDVLSGEVAFKLYDTYGFPLDLTADIARERDIGVDQAGFDVAMAAQRQRAQQASQFGVDYNEQIKTDTQSEFKGYQQIEHRSAVVVLFKAGQMVEKLMEQDQATLFLAETPFYAESGGQVGDQGVLLNADGKIVFQVKDTQYFGKGIGHIGEVFGEIKIGEPLIAKIDAPRRQAIRRNHTATHLLHAALREHLGEQVTQKGSLVDDAKLRFDFSYAQAVSNEKLRDIEHQVNTQILKNTALTSDIMAIEAAKEAGALALFGEKYEEQVRVIEIPGFSIELCGGTHVDRTGDIGLFRILSESGVASGVRRIEAVTGDIALQAIQSQDEALQHISLILKADKAQLKERIEQLLSKQKALEKENTSLQQKIAAQSSADLTQNPEMIAGVKVVIQELKDFDPKNLRDLLDSLKVKLGEGILLLAVCQTNKVNLIAGVTKDLTHRVKAGDLVNQAAQVVGGKGGGRPDMAQAGGSQPEKISAAFEAARRWLENKLA